MFDTRFKSTAGAAALVLALLAPLGEAQALSNRAWVSRNGVDAANCGAAASPCRSLQFAHDSIVAPGGEIDILDPGGYGPLTITKSISIVNDGVGTAGVQQNAAGQDAIVVNAGATDSVFLRGLTIDGVQQTARFGVNIVNAGSVSIIGCTIRRFSGSGVMVAQTYDLQLSLTDVVSSDNDAGVFLEPTGALRATMTRLTANANKKWGLTAISEFSGAAGLLATVSDSVFSNNAIGVYVSGLGGHPTPRVAVSNSTMSNNSDYGVAVDSFSNGIAYLTLGRTRISGNSKGAWSLKPPGVIRTMGDNMVIDNPLPAGPGMTPSSPM